MRYHRDATDSDDESEESGSSNGYNHRKGDDGYFSSEGEDEEEEKDVRVFEKAQVEMRTTVKKRKMLVRGSSASGPNPLANKVPLMRAHIRKNKKVPGSVKKPTKDTICMLKSSVKGRPDVVFFSYPAYVKKEKEANTKIVEYEQGYFKNKQIVFKIAETTNIYNSVVNSCKNAGFYLVDSGRNWNILF